MNNINKFTFQNWGQVPELISGADKNELTVEEKHLLSAIKLAYFACEDGRAKLAKSAGFLVISLITLISLISLITSPSQRLASEAQAKTITQQVNQTISNTIESTRSAILRH